MARSKRFKVQWGVAWYHLYNHVAACVGEYPLSKPAAARKLLALFQFYASVYECALAAVCVMGNHYHVVARFERFLVMSRKELMKRAKMLNAGPLGEKRLECWGDEDWARFNRRLFDVSEFMKDVQQRFSVWYNARYKRRGYFWGDRFKATVLDGPSTALGAVVYAELNPVRAGLVRRPEDHRYSSCFLRSAGKAEWLMDLSQLTGIAEAEEAKRYYRSMLYWCGAVKTREKKGVIPEEIVRAEEARGFAERGCFRRRIGYYRDGLAVGCSEFVIKMLARARDAGIFRRRKHPLRGRGPECCLRAYRMASEASVRPDNQATVDPGGVPDPVPTAPGYGR